MQITRIFGNPFHEQFGQDSNGLDDTFGDGDVGFGIGIKGLPVGYGLPGMKHVMQVYLMPQEHEQSSWRVAGMAMLLVTGLLAALIILYYCVVYCCCRQKKPVTEDAENVDETPSNVDGEHRVSIPTDLPPLGASEKQPRALFLESPSLDVTMPYQPEPEDLARMQEVMLAQLESSPEDWEMGHGGRDTKHLF